MRFSCVNISLLENLFDSKKVYLKIKLIYEKNYASLKDFYSLTNRLQRPASPPFLQ